MSHVSHMLDRLTQFWLIIFIDCGRQNCVLGHVTWKKWCCNKRRTTDTAVGSLCTEDPRVQVRPYGNPWRRQVRMWDMSRFVMIALLSLHSDNVIFRHLENISHAVILCFGQIFGCI